MYKQQKKYYLRPEGYLFSSENKKYHQQNLSYKSHLQQCLFFKILVFNS